MQEEEGHARRSHSLLVFSGFITKSNFGIIIRCALLPFRILSLTSPLTSLLSVCMCTTHTRLSIMSKRTPSTLPSTSPSNTAVLGDSSCEEDTRGVCLGFKFWLYGYEREIELRLPSSTPPPTSVPTRTRRRRLHQSPNHPHSRLLSFPSLSIPIAAIRSHSRSIVSEIGLSQPHLPRQSVPTAAFTSTSVVDADERRGRRSTRLGRLRDQVWVQLRGRHPLRRSQLWQRGGVLEGSV